MEEKILRVEVSIKAPPVKIWERWTTPSGIRSFFAPACNVEMKPGGAYEIFFYPDNPTGMRGADSQIVLALEEPRMLTFTWNFPQELADIRDQRTVVVVRIDRSGNDASTVVLSQLGWGSGESWLRGYDYFKRAWGSIVLPRLRYSFVHGPIDWTNPPTTKELLQST